MKKQLFLILLTIFSMSGIWSFAQDTAPSPIPTKLIAPNSPVWYYNTLDSSLWVFKGQTGWLRIATNAQLQKYYWSKTQITNADTARWGLNAGHDSLTIAAGSTDYFEVNYPQIFSGQKLIDTLGVLNTKIAGKAPAFLGTANYIPKFGSSGTTLENSLISQSSYEVNTNGVAYYKSASGLVNHAISLGSTGNSYGLVGYGVKFNPSGILDSYGVDDKVSAIEFFDGGFLFKTAPLGIAGNNITWTTRMSITNDGAASFNTSVNTPVYKLSGVDLFSSLTTNTLEKWDGSKHVSVANASGYLYNDGTGAMSFTAFPAAVTSISAGNGMNFTTITGTGSVVLGTPTTLTASTTNAVTTTSHTHQITGFLPLTGGALTGAVTSNNSFTGTNFILSSDKRLKQGIRTLTNTDWVERIKFVRYEMKSNPEIERYGVIAQDVEEVNKYLVHTDEYGIKSVSYIDLLVAKIANLEKRIYELETKKKRHEK